MMSLRKMASHPVSALALLIIGFLLAWFFRDIILVILVSLLLTLSLLPIVDWMERRGVRRWLAAATPLTAAVLTLAGLLVLVLPKLLQQADALLTAAPELIGNLAQRYHLYTPGSQELTNGSGQAILTATFGAFGFLAFAAAVVFFSLYWLIDYHNIKKALISFLAAKHRAHVRELSTRAERRVVAWVRGQLILSLIVGLVVVVAYTLIGLPYAIVLGVLAGIFEILPFLGPILAAIPALVLGLSISGTLGLEVFGIYLVVQTIESNILAPKVMSETVNLHPLAVILSFLIGARVAGLAGILLAIPAVLVLTAAFKVYRDAFARE